MWIPKNTGEILDAVASGALEEGLTFDAKREVGNNSKEIAKDIAAMANDGGILIYGIDEDEHGRVRVLNPIPLANTAEKIDQIAATCIVEVPRLQTFKYETEDDPAVGFLVVVVPASERAPHMVVVGKDYRYYQRHDKISIPMTEGEIARLYERRRRWEVNRGAILDSLLQQDPFPSHERLAYLRIFARPVSSVDGLLARLGSDRQAQKDALLKIINTATHYPLHEGKVTPLFIHLNTVVRPTVYGYVMESTNLEDPRNRQEIETGEHYDLASEYLRLQLETNGYGRYFCGRVAVIGFQSQKAFMPIAVVYNKLRFLFFMGTQYDQTQYLGLVYICLAITGIQGLTVSSSHRMGAWNISYGNDLYRRTSRVSALALAGSPEQYARELFMPLMDEMSRGAYDPFTDK